MSIDTDFLSIIDGEIYKVTKFRVYNAKDGEVIVGVALVNADGDEKNQVVSEEIDVFDDCDVFTNKNGDVIINRDYSEENYVSPELEAKLLKRAAGPFGPGMTGDEMMAQLKEEV